MKFVLLTTVLFLQLSQLAFGAEGTFFFKDQENWGTDSNDCDKEENSPINIITKSTIHDSKLDEPFEASESFLQTISDLTCKNTGQSYTCTVGDTATPLTITGGNLIKTPLKLLQFHVHFGSSSDLIGSEHRVDGHQYPAEIHFVFITENPSDPLQYGDLAVWGFFIDTLSNGYNAQGSLDTVLNTILSDLKEYDSSKDLIDQIELAEMIPVNNYHAMGSFYRYKGGLTTPGCNQVVQWTVFKDPLYVSEEQYQKMTKGKTWLNSEDRAEEMIDTYRKPQPLNGRPVTRTAFAGEGIVEEDDDTDSVDCKSALGSSAILSMLAILSNMLLH